jgi:hypothetical protein
MQKAHDRNMAVGRSDIKRCPLWRLGRIGLLISAVRTSRRRCHIVADSAMTAQECYRVQMAALGSRHKVLLSIDDTAIEKGLEGLDIAVRTRPQRTTPQPYGHCVIKENFAVDSIAKASMGCNARIKAITEAAATIVFGVNKATQHDGQDIGRQRCYSHWFGLALGSGTGDCDRNIIVPDWAFGAPRQKGAGRR